MSKKDCQKKKLDELNQLPKEDPNGEVNQAAEDEANFREAAACSCKCKEDQNETKLEELEKELAALKKEKEDFCSKNLRIQADFDNFRRRSRQELEQMNLTACSELLKTILPVIDNFERAINSYNAEAAVSWQEGIQMTFKHFLSILNNEGLEPIAATNEPFDPQIHEAMLQEESEEVEQAQVIEELQKGYKYKGKLIRPALVKVAVPK